MPDTKVSLMADVGVPAPEDLLYLVDVSSADPKERRLTVANLGSALGPDLPADTRVQDFYFEALTTDATPTEMTSTSGPILPVDDTSLIYVAYVVARQDGAPHSSAAYKLEGSAIRDPLGSGTVLHSGIFKTAFEEDVPAWDVTVEPAGIPLILVLKVTGSAATTIRWFAHVHVIEVQIP